MRPVACIFFLSLLLVPTRGFADPALDQELAQSSMYGEPAEIQALLDKGASPNALQNGRRAISWAAQSGLVPIVELLIAAKADVNLVDGINQTPLMRAVDLSQVAVANALIKAKADVNAKTPDGRTALTMAIANGDVEMVKTLIAAGVEPNTRDADGYSPVLRAVMEDNLEIVRALGAAKADLNLGSEYYTPLSYAVEQGQAELVAALLAGGADPNRATEGGRLPLAVALNEEAVFNLLLAAKADPNTKTADGHTILIEAITGGELSRVAALIHAGANVNLPSDSGQTPLVFAQNAYSPEIAEVLKLAGAN